MANRRLKKLYWKLSSAYYAWKFPLNKSLIYVGVTGTDGKTTTSTFLYEIAKAYGYKPLLLTTVSATFEDQKIEANLKSTSFLAYSIKNALKGLSSMNLKKFLKNFLFLDKKGFLELKETHRTTPLASEIRKLIREYEHKGANLFILETTSHSLDQERVYGIEFDSVAFTNITNEHLDYHGSWGNYAQAKSKLIQQLKKSGTVSLNRDDEKSFKYLSKVVNQSRKKLDIHGISYGISGKPDIKSFWVHHQKQSDTHVQIIASQYQQNSDDVQIGLNLFGNYNIYNAMAALSCFMGLSSSHKEIADFAKAARALSNLREISGRMNFLCEHPLVIVDFAHTPNAFKNSLSSVSDLLKKRITQAGIKPRTWVVFGTAGQRDEYKRAEMGKIAYELSDNILVTSEDPRTEDLHEINNQIIEGFRDNEDDFVIHSYYEGLKYEHEEDSKFVVRFDEPNLNSRRNAIKFAIENASEQDIIIILGKGHETTMCFGEKEYDWNDIDEVKKIVSQKSQVVQTEPVTQ